MMEFTGERYVPSIGGQIHYEHLHRYALAARFCAGRRVLDIASGEGYGSALLARVASEVTGVDVDPRSVDHARRSYYAANVRFLYGSCTQIPLGEDSVDVAVSFETIEHLTEHERMLDELRRVLVPGGVLIISSPNKLTYSDLPQYSNPYHEKELYFDEFRDLLVRRFRHVAFYGQRLAALSLVHPLGGAVSESPTWHSGARDGIANVLPTLTNPLYFVAICSDERLSVDVSSAYLDPADDLLDAIWTELNTLRHERLNGATANALPLSSDAAELPALPADQDAAPGDLAARCAALEGEIAARAAAWAELEAVAEGVKAELAETQGTLAGREAEVDEVRAVLATAESDRGLAEEEAVALRAALMAAQVDIAAHEDESTRMRDALAAAQAGLRAREEESAALSDALVAAQAGLRAREDESTALRDAFVAAQAGLAAREDESAALRATLAESRGRLAVREDELAALRESLAQAQSRLTAREGEVIALGEGLAQAQAEGVAARAQIAALNEELDQARRDGVFLREVLASHSWKVTAPLRQIVGKIRR